MNLARYVIGFGKSSFVMDDAKVTVVDSETSADIGAKNKECELESDVCDFGGVQSPVNGGENSEADVRYVNLRFKCGHASTYWFQLRWVS